MTVITIGHSVRDELDGCLRSLREHAGMPLKTILVDNASTDGTVEWVRGAYPEVEVVELRKNIWGGARNHGLAKARTPYTLFIDSDARLTAGALGAMVGALGAHSDWDMVAPRLVYPEGRLQLSCRRLPPLLLPVMRRPPLNRWLEHSDAVSNHLMRDMDYASERPVLYTIGACQLFRTAVAQRVGPLDVAIGRGGCEDIDWGIRFWLAGAEVHYVPEATVVHAYRRASSKRPLSPGAWRHLRAFARVQSKHWRRRGELRTLSDELDRRASERSVASAAELAAAERQ